MITAEVLFCLFFKVPRLFSCVLMVGVAFSLIRMWNIGGLKLIQAKTDVLGEKSVPVSLGQPQISRGQIWNRIQPNAVRAGRLTAWGMARQIELTRSNCVLDYVRVAQWTGCSSDLLWTSRHVKWYRVVMKIPTRYIYIYNIALN